MTDPTIVSRKQEIRKRLRLARREHAAALPPQVSALVFHRPPTAVLDLVPEDAVIGLYRADPGEAPASGYAKFFHERGHTIALPWLVDLQTPMIFRAHTDPYAESDLAKGYFGLMQGSEDAPVVEPGVLFMPLVAFTANGDRLGQGGGFYDKWLGAHPDVIRIGMAWDMQEVDELPIEPHDMGLTAVVTPTRVLGPFR
ncbi:5-formyltetrahydrofolate cyclo-ligase [Altererythrobacter salegens]|uniref:5-formyltetrahydrofolate cyclo-ligase n=1 Tax=Croceibacterium salegens TaxID=1737568 RepID=A0A6I4SUN1_9SPHN|nr:5-formyltetrahydrofolate cyclo-ligase [Croceibacterium salegens]MXO58700.1 5-formyltetrahydrofolate cyclo-ligase [Croceibacterium salegens]